MARMPHDYGDGPPETAVGSLRALRGWYRSLTAAGRVLVAVMAVAATGLIIGYGVAAVAVFPSGNSGTNLTRVPGLVGETTAEARQRIERAGLVFSEAAALSHPAAAGTVLAQEPLAGQVANPGSTVEVTVSLGPKRRSMPNVLGLEHQQAQSILARAGYRSELVWVDADEPVGAVVDTRPTAGTPLEQEATVRIIVSAGLPRVAVPDLVSLSLSEAQSDLERLGLRLGAVGRDSASLAAPGTVLAQSPAAGVVVDRATRIKVTVATEPVSAAEGDTAARRR